MFWHHECRKFAKFKSGILKSGQNAAGICPFFYGAFVHHGFALFFDANSLERQNSERAHGKRKIAQLKRQQFLSLDSQSIRADKDNASFEIVALFPSPHRRWKIAAISKLALSTQNRSCTDCTLFPCLPEDRSLEKNSKQEGIFFIAWHRKNWDFRGLFVRGGKAVSMHKI